MKRIIRADSMTDEEMENELSGHFNELNSRVNSFMSKRPNGRRIQSFDSEFSHIEHDTVENIIKDYIRDFNYNLKEYGNGFEYWPDDVVVSILYRDGTDRRLDPQWDDGLKRVKLDGIDSIIVDGDWGSTYAGPHVQILNYREAVKYRPEDKYGYRNVKERYDDFDDLRVQFDI